MLEFDLESDRRGRCFRTLTLTIVMLLMAITPATPTVATSKPRTLPHGAAAGDVGPASAIVWTRLDGPGHVVLELVAAAAAATPRRLRATADGAADFAVHFVLEELEPDTVYRYRLWPESAPDAIVAGSFRSAPPAGEKRAVSFVFGGDVGGQGYCRQEPDGYRIFSAMASLEPDFFVANGDMIYADGACPGFGPDGWRNVPGDFASVLDVDWRDRAVVREAVFAHWRYNLADPHMQALRSRVPTYAQWDDHEVVNDFGGPWRIWPAAPRRQGYRELVTAGRDAVFAFNPIARHATEPQRIYRSFRWGDALELFILDARSYRERNDLSDDAVSPRTVLGQEQLAWLVRGLTRSTATWKIVSSNIPLSVPTGSNAHLYGRDGFANGTDDDFSARTGRERELGELLRQLDAKNVRHLVFVVTDVHFAMSLRYDLDVDGDGDRLLFHELLSGPLNAGRSPTPPRLDPTLAPTILYGEGDLFNFGHVRVQPSADGSSRLFAEVRDETGTVRFGSRVELLAAAEDRSQDSATPTPPTP